VSAPATAGLPDKAWIADLALFAVAMVWGSSYAVTKGVIAVYPVLGFLAIRFGCTFLILLPVWRRIDPSLVGDTVRTGVPLGLVLPTH
jgi:drug/metabolite transporter (DMT)-like permease